MGVRIDQFDTPEACLTRYVLACLQVAAAAVATVAAAAVAMTAVVEVATIVAAAAAAASAAEAEATIVEAEGATRKYDGPLHALLAMRVPRYLRRQANICMVFFAAVATTIVVEWLSSTPALAHFPGSAVAEEENFCDRIKEYGGACSNGAVRWGPRASESWHAGQRSRDR